MYPGDGQVQSSKKVSHKGKNRKKQPSMESMARVPKKVCFKRHCNLCKKHGGVYTTHNIKDCCRYETDRKKKSDFNAAKKGSKKLNSARQSFTQLSKKLDKLKRAFKKLSKKSKKFQYKDSSSNSK